MIRENPTGVERSPRLLSCVIASGLQKLLLSLPQFLCKFVAGNEEEMILRNTNNARVKVVIFTLAVAWTAVISMFVVADKTFSNDGAQIVASADHTL